MVGCREFHRVQKTEWLREPVHLILQAPDDRNLPVGQCFDGYLEAFVPRQHGEGFGSGLSYAW